ncbi:reprolysin-like metallopeptidase [Streptomyces tuirus]|uniref:Peptidase M10 metallopeptidase domain-containing protein n=1 Tax=Streptomyces tuirus TaxID=68278 RepID=A0A7G1NII4_9ACTN|nr:hypothetical protein [Streptomyces tuirus]BCL21567.1 hypothetical protein GCM10017668_34100 [Streptomyces tuirus]
MAAAGLVVTLASPSWALDFDNMFKTSNTDWDCWDGERDNGLYCRTDNATLTITREPGMTAKGDQDIVDTLRNEYSPTHLAVHVKSQSEASYEGSAETDIVYDYHEYSGSITGIAWCNDATSDYECDQHYVEFDDTDPYMNTICHETGHAVGLTHGQEASPRVAQDDSRLACMRNYRVAEWRDLGSHNTATINAMY